MIVHMTLLTRQAPIEQRSRRDLQRGTYPRFHQCGGIYIRGKIDDINFEFKTNRVLIQKFARADRNASSIFFSISNTES